MIVNLLCNAKDVLIERKIKDAYVHIKVKKEAEMIEISVCDNGGGIPESELTKVFEPYFTTKEEGKGTGVGLYMSKIIIEDHMDGKIKVMNSDEGCCFSILFKS